MIIHTWMNTPNTEAGKSSIHSQPKTNAKPFAIALKYARRGELIVFPDNFPVRDTTLSLAQEADIECVATDDPRLKEK
jgi:hypothetical protein